MKNKVLETMVHRVSKKMSIVSCLEFLTFFQLDYELLSGNMELPENVVTILSDI